MSSLCSLPENVHCVIFQKLRESSPRSDVVNLGLTCKHMMYVLRSTQAVLCLPNDERLLSNAIGNVVRALPTNTKTLSLSDASLEDSCQRHWEALGPLPQITAVRIPKGQPLSIPWTFPIPARRRPPSAGGNLVTILRQTPNVSSLSISVDPPGPARSLIDLSAYSLLSRQFLSKIESLHIAAFGLYLHHEAEVLVPELVRRLPKLTYFTLILPPRIIPNSFITHLIAALKEATCLRESRLSVPFYAFPKSFDGYGSMPHLKCITLQHSARGNKAGKTGLMDTIYEHLPLWNELEVLCLLDAPRVTLQHLVEILRHRISRIQVLKRSDVHPNLVGDWQLYARASNVRFGINVEDVREIFCDWFIPSGGFEAKYGTTLSGREPMLDTETASTEHYINCCIISLVPCCRLG